eukprot:768817-Hanusia_phi.AAC.13
MADQGIEDSHLPMMPSRSPQEFVEPEPRMHGDGDLFRLQSTHSDGVFNTFSFFTERFEKLEAFCRAWQSSRDELDVVVQTQRSQISRLVQKIDNMEASRQRQHESTTASVQELKQEVHETLQRERGDIQEIDRKICENEKRFRELRELSQVNKNDIGEILQRERDDVKEIDRKIGESERKFRELRDFAQVNKNELSNLCNQQARILSDVEYLRDHLSQLQQMILGLKSDFKSTLLGIESRMSALETKQTKNMISIHRRIEGMEKQYYSRQHEVDTSGQVAKAVKDAMSSLSVNSMLHEVTGLNPSMPGMHSLQARLQGRQQNQYVRDFRNVSGVMPRGQRITQGDEYVAGEGSLILSDDGAVRA